MQGAERTRLLEAQYTFRTLLGLAGQGLHPFMASAFADTKRGHRKSDAAPFLARKRTESRRPQRPDHGDVHKRVEFGPGRVKRHQFEAPAQLEDEIDKEHRAQDAPFVPSLKDLGVRSDF